MADLLLHINRIRVACQGVADIAMAQPMGRWTKLNRLLMILRLVSLVPGAFCSLGRFNLGCAAST